MVSLLQGDHNKASSILGIINEIFSMWIKMLLFYWATVCKTVRPMLSVRCLSVCPVLSVPVCAVRAL